MASIHLQDMKNMYNDVGLYMTRSTFKDNKLVYCTESYPGYWPPELMTPATEHYLKVLLKL